MEMTRNEHITEDAAKITKLEDVADIPRKEAINGQDGSDSGVEMGTRCRYHTFEGDDTSSCVHSTSPCFAAESHETRQSTPGDGESNGESSLISYDGASENGSESSSLDDTKKCRPSCINVQKVYCAKTNCCRPAPSNRSKLTSFSNDSTFRYGSRQSTSAKCAPIGDSPKNSPTEKNRSLRSCSGSRTRTTMSPDETKWLDKSKTKPLPYSLSDTKVTTYEAYATLPRRKQKENADTRSPREPSLNRAASLRKKFLENSLMTTSLNSSISPSSQPKTIPPYVKSRTKTKIYHEIATQTALTNADVDRALTDSPFKIFNERVPPQTDDKSEKRAEEELRKLKKENTKQRTVIEWLEGELSAAKEEKLRIHNRLASVEQRICNLLIHKGAKEDVLSQLEREVSGSSGVIARQQKEINELQQLCCIMQKDLDSIHSAQKASEVESLELQEFLQAEKSTLTDSLRDLEAELEACKKRIKQQEDELTNKNNECVGLTALSEQLKQENRSMKIRLATLERRCKELLVHQGAVTSSASVALSGLGSRFEQLLEQLTTSFDIADADLQDDIYQNRILSNGHKEHTNTEASRSVTPSWLRVISNIMSKTSAGKQDCTNGDEMPKNSTDCSSSKNTEEQKNSSSLNLTTSDDSLCLSKFGDDESRRNSILSEVYVTDENLTLDFGVTESLTDISESVLMRKNLERFNAESFNHDVSLVEQVLEIDNIVSKVFKAILFIELNGKSTIDG